MIGNGEMSFPIGLRHHCKMILPVLDDKLQSVKEKHYPAPHTHLLYRTIHTHLHDTILYCYQIIGCSVDSYRVEIQKVKGHLQVRFLYHGSVAR